MRKKYKNPPLIEALCEFYFAPETSQDFDRVIDLLYQEIQTSFPKKYRLQLQASQINVDTSGAPEITEQLLPLVRFQSSTEQLRLVRLFSSSTRTRQPNNSLFKTPKQNQVENIQRNQSSFPQTKKRFT